MWLYVPLKKLSFESLIEILIVNKKVFKFLTIVPAIVRIKKRVMGRKEKENMVAFVCTIYLSEATCLKYGIQGGHLCSSKVSIR